MAVTSRRYNTTFPSAMKLCESPWLIWLQEASKRGASATEWAATISSVVGGKAGGKTPTSIGNGTNVEKVNEALEVAEKYLERFHL